MSVLARLMFPANRDPEFALREYAIATFLRAQYFVVPNWHQRWADAVGATSFVTREPIDPRNSRYSMISDGQYAIIAFDGTRGNTQWFNNVVGTRQRTDAVSGRSFHSYFLWRAEHIWDDVFQWLNENPPSGGVLFAGHSLGGSIAHIIRAKVRALAPEWDAGLLTFGQPRTVGGFNTTEEIGRYHRVVWKFDPIPNLPARVSLELNAMQSRFLPFEPSFFHHTTQAAILLGNGRFRYGENPPDGGLDAAARGAILTRVGLLAWRDPIHDISRYAAELRKVAIGRGLFSEIYEFDALNDQIDRNELPGDGIPTGANVSVPVVVTIPAATDPPPSTNPFLDPDAVFGAGGQWPTIPLDHVGQKVEQRVVGHKLFFFGGPDIMAKTFQAHDRKMLQTLKKVCTNIQLRDALVDIPKKTRKLSNRIKMFPAAGSPTLASKLNDIIVQATTLLAQGA